MHHISSSASCWMSRATILMWYELLFSTNTLIKTCFGFPSLPLCTPCNYQLIGIKGKRIYSKRGARFVQVKALVQCAKALINNDLINNCSELEWEQTAVGWCPVLPVTRPQICLTYMSSDNWRCSKSQCLPLLLSYSTIHWSLLYHEH